MALLLRQLALDEALSTSDLYLSVGVVCACGARQLYVKKRTAARRIPGRTCAHMAALAVGGARQLICACGTRQLSEEAQAARLLMRRTAALRRGARQHVL
eukprot:scaffold11321_cov141-Isochrysis_galbana.AAC.6